MAVRRDEPRKGDREAMKERAAAARRVAVVSDAASAADLLFFSGLVAGAYALLLLTGFHWLACLVALFLVAKAQNGLLLSGEGARCCSAAAG
jgi:hypothetical protein